MIQNIQPVIRTDDFILKLATADDVQALLCYRIENKDFFQKTEPHRHADYYTLDSAQALLESLESLMAQNRSVNFLIWQADERRIIGVINFSQIVPHPFNACYLGYSLHHDFWGCGIMTKALTLAIGQMFDNFKLHRIMANYLPSNARSGRVLEKLGFVQEGFAKNYLEINGKWQDHILTSLTNHQLPAITAP